MRASLRYGRRSRHILPWSARLLPVLGLCLLPASALAADQASGPIAWLAAPMDPSRAHDVDSLTSWHGRLMVLVWAVLFPAGVLAARFFKIMPGQDWPRELDDKRWWRTHLITQYGGGALLLVAVVLGTYATGTVQDTITDGHHLLGWSVAVLAAWQFSSGWLRGSKGGPTDPGPDGALHGDHYAMTRRRRLFEYAHKLGGYLALLTACVAIVTGLHAANAPRWMGLGLLGWWLCLIGLAVWLQRQGFARDTYQAIWGPGSEHPGNRLRPIGLGIRRANDGAPPDHAD